MPIINIKTEGGVDIDTKDEYKQASVTIKGGRHFENIPATQMEIRGRGNSTWWLHPKKPYQMKFEDKFEMLRMPEDRRWIFLAEYSDKTLVRNKVAFELGYMSNLDWTPQSVYVEVFVNNEYGGTYHVSQKVEETNNRIPLGDHGYLIEVNHISRLDDEGVYFEGEYFLLNIKEPNITAGSPEYDFIQQYIKDFEAALFGDDFKNPELGYAKYIDVNSVVEWYVINEIAKNQDSKDFSSIFMTLMPGEKMKMGPIWDFDLGFGNVDYSEAQYHTGFWVKDHAWISRLFEDPSFVAKVKDRFDYFRGREADIMEVIDENTALLHLSQNENNHKWGLIGNYVWPNPVVYGSYREEVNHLKDWINQRLAWLDREFKKM